MGLNISDYVEDGALLRAAEANCLVYCSQEPTTYAEAYTTYMLMRVTMVAGDGNDFTIGTNASIPAGRQVVTAAKSGQTPTNSGQANHVALVDTVNSRFLLTWPISAVNLTAGQSYNVPAQTFDTDGGSVV